jgi:hypothetical protein
VGIQTGDASRAAKATDQKEATMATVIGRGIVRRMFLVCAITGTFALTLFAAPAVALADAAHPPLQAPCFDPAAPCISAHEPPVAPAGTITVTGYIASATAQTMMVAITDPRTNTVVYSAYATSIPLTGDYAGYSQFRFSVPMTYPGGILYFNEYLQIRVYGMAGSGKSLRITSVSNLAQIWSPGARL